MKLSPEQKAALLKRFLKHVNKTDNCWLWLAGTHKYGYGSINVLGKTCLAHRISYILFISDSLPNTTKVLHACDNPPCVNPDHLFLGSSKDNRIDCVTKGRNNSPTGDKNGSRTHPESRPRGESNKNSKLKLLDILAIRKRYAEGETGTSLAIAFHVSNPTIYKIVTNKAWKEVVDGLPT